jgi:hypothetical protein
MPWPMPTYGMNVGNELELNWGPPNAALFSSAVQNGFNAVRIPCAWEYSGATTNISGGVTNYVISASYMAQVKQTVDAAIAAGMYVMINDHWDDGWLQGNLGTTVDPIVNAKVKSYWTQIATTFAGYDNHLLFAASNEPGVASPAVMDTLMFYYQTFVNTVRGVGGNNTNRWLVLQGGGDTTWLNSLPTDTVSNRLMVEYHNYSPFQFTQLQGDASWGAMQYYWGPAYHYPGDPSHDCGTPEEGAMDAGFQQLVDQYVSKGIPVMIGEFQAAGKSVLSTNATEQAWNSLSCYYWNKYLVDSAIAHGMSPFYWSTGGSPFDYGTGAVDDSQVVTTLTGGAAPPPPNGAPYAASGLTATASNTNVNLSWTAGSGATSYNLYRAAESGGEGTNPVVTGITGTSYTDTNLNSGTPYYYLVAAVNSSGPAGFSPEAHATTTGVNPDPAQFNFESDSQGWVGGGGIISGLATSTTQSYAGRQSLAVNFNGSSSGSSIIYVQSTVVAPGQTITFHVWIPSGSKISSIQPYIQDHNWNATSGNNASLAANAWNTFTLTVPQTAVTPFQNLAIQFNTSAGWTGTCYVDSISWNTPAPDFNLSANPTSLTVKGGTNGTSVVTVSPTNGLNGCYTLSASNLPTGVTATFGTNPTTSASTLTFTASNTVTSGTSNVTITTTCGLLSHTTTIALTLNALTLPNTAPTLSPITSQTVNVGQTVAFTASATDTDSPPQTLTFALLAGTTNATLNTSSGAFSFRPLVTQAKSTNNFTLEVSDNGTPSMSATQSFYVIVNPLSAPGISSFSINGGQFGFNINGQSGPDYAVEASTNLTQWSTVFTTNSPALPFTWTDATTNSPQRFYRIKLGPPLP